MKRLLYDKIKGEWVLNENKFSSLVKFLFIIIIVFITLKIS